ncbi:hypothetical protein JCM11641_002223 [Rhodosporidiobolus odoratus]
MATNLSKRSAGVRRLLQEAAELASDPETSYNAAPLEDDLFSWHFTIKGPGGDFQGGQYHGKLTLPSEYPFKPPEVYLLTPSGRFEVNKKVCLSISSFHPETWQPSWGIRTAMLALTAFFETEPKGAVGSLDAPPAERRRLAHASKTWCCSACGYNAADPESHAGLPVAVEGEREKASSGAEEEANGGVKIELIEAEKVQDDAQQSEEILATSKPSTPASGHLSDEEDSSAISAALPTASSAPTAIFPSAPARSSSHPHAPLPHHTHTHPHPHRAPSPGRLDLPLPATSSSASVSASSPSSSHIAHSLSPPGAPRLSAAHLPPPSPLPSPSPSPYPTSSSPSSPTPILSNFPQTGPPPPPPPPLALAAGIAPESSSTDGEWIGGGGPPGWVDRAILVVLLALVAAVVRKVA